METQEFLDLFETGQMTLREFRDKAPEKLRERFDEGSDFLEIRSKFGDTFELSEVLDFVGISRIKSADIGITPASDSRWTIFDCRLTLNSGFSITIKHPWKVWNMAELKMFYTSLVRHLVAEQIETTICGFDCGSAQEILTTAIHIAKGNILDQFRFDDKGSKRPIHTGEAIAEILSNE